VRAAVSASWSGSTRVVAAGGISVMVSGGRRCRRHPHLDGQRAPSALLLVVSKRRSMTAVFDRRQGRACRSATCAAAQAPDFR
jgi:hypothetical protein